VTVEVARRYGNALDAENWKEARALLAPDVEIVRPSGRRYRGADHWIELISRPHGFEKIDSHVGGRQYEQRNGKVVEVTDIVHHWCEDGALAYTSREETAITFRDGRIARLESTVEHKAPE
jgi:ketosteroid isomerase-like protein